eukprot:23412-Eustigmatos_ZCMA.PRE.1
MSGTFNYVVIVCKSKHEPLYEYLERKLPKDQLMICEGVAEMPPLDDLKSKGQILMAFDDLCLEEDESSITQVFIRGRKVGGGISCVYLTQTYDSVPKCLRCQCGYIFISKLKNEKDLAMILKRCV